MESQLYRFGPFRLFPTEQLLLRDEEAIPLAPKAFELLVVLVTNQGRLMRRDDLIDAVWGDSFVEEINLTVNISLLRKLLGAAPDGSGYIVTVPKRGYRFEATVVEQSGAPRGGRLTLEKGHDAANAQPLASQSASFATGLAEQAGQVSGRSDLIGAAGQDAPRGSSSKVRFPAGRVGMVAFLIVILVLGGWLLRRFVWPPGRTGIHSIAVLPFEFIGADPASAYLGLGMTDALVTRLGGQDKLTVRPISAVRQFAGATDLVKAGRSLRVDAVLDGTVQRTEGATRVTVRLLRVDSGKVVWTDIFDQAAGSEFALEDAISERLAEALTLHLTDEEQRRLTAPKTRNGAAYDLYTRGRVLLNNRSVESVRNSLDLFEGAIRADPNYAAAYAGLADAYILAGSYGNSFLAPSVSAPKAEEAVKKALALDNGSPEAHTSLAYLRFTYDWNWSGAEEEFREAIRLDPAYVNARHWYSHELLALGRVSESHEQSEEALRLDPADVLLNEHMAWHHLFSREYKTAITQGQKAVEIDPGFVQAHRVLGLAYLYSGDTAKACPEFVTGVQLSHQDPVAQAYLARCYALTHREALARSIAGDLMAASRERYISAAEIGAIFAALKDRRATLHWLAQAVDERASALIYLNIDPVFDWLRSDPGFQEIVARIGLPSQPVRNGEVNEPRAALTRGEAFRDGAVAH